MVAHGVPRLSLTRFFAGVRCRLPCKIVECRYPASPSTRDG
jgi:hypothetical protein